MSKKGSLRHLGLGLLLVLAAAAVRAHGDAELTDAEVRKVDKATGKITLRHAEIRNLEMPAMTMVFGVRDAALLERVKPGDKVRFVAEKRGTALIVTTLEPAP